VTKSATRIPTEARKCDDARAAAIKARLAFCKNGLIGGRISY
jgi:hypothetical protein